MFVENKSQETHVQLDVANKFDSASTHVIIE